MNLCELNTTPIQSVNKLEKWRGITSKSAPPSNRPTSNWLKKKKYFVMICNSNIDVVRIGRLSVPSIWIQYPIGSFHFGDFMYSVSWLIFGHFPNMWILITYLRSQTHTHTHADTRAPENEKRATKRLCSLRSCRLLLVVWSLCGSIVRHSIPRYLKWNVFDFKCAFINLRIHMNILPPSRSDACDTHFMCV